MKDLKISLLLDLYGGILTQKQSSVLDCYYNLDLSLSEIAINEGITRQGVRDSLKRAETLLLDMEEKLQLCEKNRDAEQKLHKIYSMAEQISQFNIRLSSSKEIDNLSSEIMSLTKTMIETD